ncbi:MAG: type I DNA topoisomerase [Candidatus Pacebacteria bacterium]|nr:type I DNA topoisomerase [Candidatus Paceibacterota bacterium]
MKLFIVESPAKAKTIGKYLGDGYTVKASVGHVRDLPKSNKKAVDIEGGFVPHYEISKGKEKIVEELKSLAKKATEVILATDPDREGEAIAWHIVEATGLKKGKTKRVVYHEITEDAIKDAIAHPRDIDENLKEAQEARRVLDRLVGYDLSGIIWKKVRYGLSAGRVQSPALRIIMEREREIRAFKSHTFWIITADTETAKKDKLPLTCVEEPTAKKEVDRILEVGKKEKWVVESVAETEAKRSPRAPFITSTLQQSASSRLGFSPSRTMQVAQRLYEAGHITYMRTDSTNLSQTALDGIQKEITKKWGKELFVPHTYSKKSKNAQEAHEAIRPSHFEKESAGLNDEQQKLYRLIWRRAVSSQMADAKILRTKITVKVGEGLPGQGKIPDFATNGSRVLSPGWLLADPAARGEDVEVQKVVAGDVLDLKEMHTEEKQTEPPPRYSEAGLVKELEKRGIGRPSTYAAIIKTLEDRGYVEKIQKALCPTDTGDVVSSFLEENFKDYISDTFTAEMEDKLDLIAEGKTTYLKTLTDFYKPFLKELKSKDKLDKVTNLGDAPAEFKCPKCGAPMVIKLSKTGKFMSCSKFPDCLGARNMEGKELEGPKETGEICPDCGGKLVLREGRFGQFISCANYPKCKYIKKDAELERKNSTGVQCPLCKEGMMTERKGRFGLFYSCSNYPKCKHIIKSKPTGNICPMCQSLMMAGTKTIPERCSSKSCPNHNPHKLNK